MSAKWRQVREIRRADTAVLLIVGGFVSLIVTAATYYLNRKSISSALSPHRRGETFWAGILLLGASTMVLMTMTQMFQRAVHSLIQLLKEEGERVEFPTTKKQLRDRMDRRKSARAYYAVVSVELASLWILATSTGGYVNTPLGLMFTSAVLFGQIRGNKRQDMFILFAMALLGAALSDLVVHRKWLGDYFAPSGAIKIAAWTWYVAILSSTSISTVINIVSARWKDPTEAAPALL